MHLFIYLSYLNNPIITNNSKMVINTSHMVKIMVFVRHLTELILLASADLNRQYRLTNRFIKIAGFPDFHTYDFEANAPQEHPFHLRFSSYQPSGTYFLPVISGLLPHRCILQHQHFSNRHSCHRSINSLTASFNCS